MARYTRRAREQVSGPDGKPQKLNDNAVSESAPLPIVQDAIEPEIDAVEENMNGDVRDTPEDTINVPSSTDDFAPSMFICHKTMEQVFLKLGNENPEPIKEFAKNFVADMDQLSKNLKSLPTVVSLGPKKFADEIKWNVSAIAYGLCSKQYIFLAKESDDSGTALIKLYEEAIAKLEKIWGSVEEMKTKPEPPHPKTAVNQPPTDPQPPLDRQPIVNDDME